MFVRAGKYWPSFSCLFFAMCRIQFGRFRRNLLFPPPSTHGSFLGPVVDFVIVGESALYRFSGKTPAPSSISPNGVDRSGRSIDGPRKLPDPSQSARGLLFLRHGAKIKIPPRNSTSNVYVLIDTEKSTDRHCPRTMKSAQKCITVKVIGGVKKVRAE